MFLDKKIHEHYADCGTDWEFSDNSFAELQLKQ
jgi:hypothetical protein